MHTNYYMNITRAQCAMHNHVIRMGLGEKDSLPVASVPGLPRYAFTLRFNFAGEGTF